MTTALTPEAPIPVSEEFKVWLKAEYAILTAVHDMLFQSDNPQMHNIHARRWELIKVGRKVGLELAPPSLEELEREEN